MIEVKVTRKDYTDDILSDLQRKGLQFVLEGGSEIQKEAAARINNISGNLASSIQVEAFAEDGIPTSETGPTAEYAPYVEYGTGIYAKDGNGRKTPWTYKDERTGEWIRTRGGRPHPFMETGYNAARKVIDTLFGKILGIL